jgi:hypothetical protein
MRGPICRFDKLTSQHLKKEEKGSTSTRAIRRLLKTAYKNAGTRPPLRGHSDGLSKAGREPTVSLPHHHLARRHAVDASEPPSGESELRTRPRIQHLQPSAPIRAAAGLSPHPMAIRLFVHARNRSASRHPQDDGKVRDRLGNAGAGMALNMRLPSAPQHRRRAGAGLQIHPPPLPPTTGTPPPQPLDGGGRRSP